MGSHLAGSRRNSSTVSRLGAIVQSAKIGAEGPSLREASIEAEFWHILASIWIPRRQTDPATAGHQASARILSTARELFETLLQVARLVKDANQHTRI